MRHAFTAALCILSLATAPQADAFCGFYVAKADARLFNKASKVVVAHNDDKTVVTMASDYEGDMKEFAVVIPVPEVITREQVHITENALVDEVDAYSAPRLVEYFDDDPCRPHIQMMKPRAEFVIQPGSLPSNGAAERAQALGVKIEAQYTVGEYDILILSARESDGLETWLKETGYKIPEGASAVLGSYIRQGMKFFVARVNLKEQEKTGSHFLRPIQVAYESPKFMLPIRLGTVNAEGPQELFIYMLTQKGRVETTNYRTIEAPTGMNVPMFVKDEFGDFYKAMFDTQVKKNDMRGVFLEYAWNMNWCDPCAAPPIDREKLRELGAFWIMDPQGGMPGSPPIAQPMPMMRIRPGIMRAPFNPLPSQDVFITRLHVRYDRAHFPEDLMFEETPNAQTFQARYVLQHPWKGEAACEAGERYRRTLPERFSKEAENLAALTGWDIATIHAKMENSGQSFNPAEMGKPLKWYQQLWRKDTQ